MRSTRLPPVESNAFLPCRVVFRTVARLSRHNVELHTVQLTSPFLHSRCAMPQISDVNLHGQHRYARIQHLHHTSSPSGCAYFLPFSICKIDYFVSACSSIEYSLPSTSHKKQRPNAASLLFVIDCDSPPPLPAAGGGALQPP